MEQENKIKAKESTSIPYFVHEGTLARFERINKRLWIVIILLIFLLVGTNAGWLWYEAQWEDVSIAQELTQDSGEGGTNTYNGKLIGGDYYGQTDGENNNQNP